MKRNPSEKTSQIASPPDTEAGSRMIEVDGKSYDVPANIFVTDRGWLCRHAHTGHVQEDRWFEDKARAKTLAEAIAYLELPMPRVAYIERQVLRETGDGRVICKMRYVAGIDHHIGENPAKWMMVPLGDAFALTQEKLDSAFNELSRRLDYYEAIVANVGRIRARRMMPNKLPDEFEGGPPSWSVRLVDVMAWTGNSESVRFDPNRGLDPERTDLYWPELKQTLAAHCPELTFKM